jgi:probable HAF family extracellular repeat protein
LLERRVPPPKGWFLSRATGISQDGYTICGVGSNPDGKLEGWVAKLPPILHPPIVTAPGTAVVPPGVAAFIQVKASNSPTSYSAANLPKGFQIDKTSGLISGFWGAGENEAAFYTIKLKAENADGSGTASFILILPPPEGFQKTIEGHSFLPYAKPPGETYFPTSFGFGLSGNGQVAVGYSGPNNDPRAYRFAAADGMTPLPIVEGALYAYSNAYAASADGRVIVGEATAAATENGPGNRVAVMWNATSTSSSLSSPGTRALSEPAAAPNITVTSLGFLPGGTSSVAYGVSADGTVIAGYGSDYDPDVLGSGIRQAFRWTATEGMVGLGWLQGGIVNSSTALAVSTDGSVIVGGSSAANGGEAFRWTAAEGMKGLGLPSGASFGRATGISADNSTIIGHNGFSNHNHAFRWTVAEGMTDLGFLPGDNVSEANAISADGSIIVGRSAVDFNPARAFIWDKTNGMRELKSVLVAGNPHLAGWTLRDALSISADGTIVVGWGQNPSGDLEGFTAYLEVKPPQLLNISTRMRVQTGENVLIGGFIITGTEPKKVIIRGIGPSLSSFFSGPLADPTLELRQGNTTIARNDNWKEHEAEVVATTIPPRHDLESAIVTTLTPGNYTAILSDKNGESGVGVVEVYDLAQAANSKLANISSRGFVATDDSVMIGGLIVGGGSGVGSGRVLLRAIGPSLSGAGITGALQDPNLELFDGSGTSIASNDDWKTTQRTEIEATTIPPTDDRESAIIATLLAGNYTAIVRGNNNTAGVAVVEAYNLP